MVMESLVEMVSFQLGSWEHESMRRLHASCNETRADNQILRTIDLRCTEITVASGEEGRVNCFTSSEKGGLRRRGHRYALGH
jgi:hypothetical protein